MKISFLKMHGCGNDFVIIDERRGFAFAPGSAARLASRHTGIGCDQVILINPSNDATADMRILNPDGSEAGACGNATRCVADILMREFAVASVVIRTSSGPLLAIKRADGLIEVDMGRPRLDWRDIPLKSPMDTLELDVDGNPAAASMGNPHVTFFVDDLQRTPVASLGPAFESHVLFPQRANVGFAQILDAATIRLRVWERGAGLTLACGSGACAALVNARRRNLTGPRAKVVMDGGTLDIEWRDDGHVMMSGPVATVFAGEIELP